MARLELLKVPCARRKVSLLEALGKVLSLNLTTDTLGLGLVRLLLHRLSLRLECWRRRRRATEQHTREAMADRGANRYGTRGSGHLCEHAGLLRLRLGGHSGRVVCRGRRRARIGRRSGVRTAALAC